MKRWALDRVVQWKLRGMRFPYQSERTDPACTREILGSFGMGAHASLRRLPAPAVAALESQVALPRRFFFWEGYAFGLAGQHALSWSAPRSLDDRRIISHYRAMHYTGYGFWNGLAQRYHLPRISRRAEDWATVEDYERFSPLIAGGAAFALTAAEGALTERVIDRVRFPGDPVWTLGAMHGCGRALWFLYMDDIERLERVFTQYPEVSDALVEGVGVAIGFTRLPTPERILATVRRFAPRYRCPLMVGVGTCLFQSTEDEPQLKSAIQGVSEPDLRHAYDMCRHVHETVRSGPRWYSECEAMLRSVLAESVAGDRVDQSPLAADARGGARLCADREPLRSSTSAR